MRFNIESVLSPGLVNTDKSVTGKPANTPFAMLTSPPTSMLTLTPAYRLDVAPTVVFCVAPI